MDLHFLNRIVSLSELGPGLGVHLIQGLVPAVVHEGDEAVAYHFGPCERGDLDGGAPPARVSGWPAGHENT